MDDHPDDYFVTAPTRRAPGPAAPPEASPPGSARSSGPVIAALVLGIAVTGAVLVSLLLTFVSGGDTQQEAAPAGSGPSPAATSSQVGEARVGTAAPAPLVEDGFALWGRRDDGSAVRWNPCDPIRWVLNPDGAPPSAQTDIAAALSLAADHSGLTFRFDGFTDETASWERPLHQPAAYGDRWAPVLFAWTGDGDDLVLRSDQRGAAVPIAVSSGTAGTLFVTGQVILNAEKDLVGGFGERSTSWGAVVAHEVGHLVGLDHVDDPTQLMYPEAGTGASTFGIGDRAGLAAVGDDGGCLEVPVARDLPVDYRAGLRP